MKRFFTILGGMGTMATESYLRILNQRTPAQKDQDYLNYILVNDATVPDRTRYILDYTQPNFLPDLLEDIQQQKAAQPDFFVMVCNTAHYFYSELAAAAAPVPFLHMPRVAINEMAQLYPTQHKIGLIATAGTIADHVYEQEIKRVGGTVELGDAQVQAMVNELIYTDIKNQNKVDHELFHRILKTMHDDFGCSVIVLGCTELSLAQELAGDHPYHVIDAQSIIADKSIELAQAFRKDVTQGQKLAATMLAK